MSIVRNLGDDTALVDATLTGYSETPVTGVGGALPYASVKVNGVETARIGGVAFTQFSAQGVGANVPLVLTPKGSGALQAQVADGTAAGGNARGVNAVDWQMLRGSPARNAAGAYSVIGGGDSNQALSTGSTVAGGSNNLASGVMSWCPGGQYGDARSMYGIGVWGSGRFASNGDAQSAEMVLRRSTSDATPTALTADGGAPSSANQFVLANNGTASLRIQVVARDTTSNAKALWDFIVLARREGNAAATVISSQPSSGTPQAPTIQAGVFPGTITLNADTVAGGVRIDAIGSAGANIRWVARVSLVELTS